MSCAFIHQRPDFLSRRRKGQKEVGGGEEEKERKEEELVAFWCIAARASECVASRQAYVLK